jgi:hypothetical protein
MRSLPAPLLLPAPRLAGLLLLAGCAGRPCCCLRRWAAPAAAPPQVWDALPLPGSAAPSQHSPRVVAPAHLGTCRQGGQGGV